MNIDKINQQIIEEHNKELAEKAGLTEAGYNDEGELEFIGTDQEWAAYEKYKEQAEEDFMERPYLYN